MPNLSYDEDGEEELQSGDLMGSGNGDSGTSVQPFLRSRPRRNG